MKRATSSPSPGMQKKRQMTSVVLAPGGRLALAHARDDVLDGRQRQEVDERPVAELAAEPQHAVAQRGDRDRHRLRRAASRA